MQDAIRSLIRALNDAWQKEDWAALEGCYHKDVVLMPPDAGPPILGRDEVLETYREFCKVARLERFREVELDVFHFERTHIVHMRFEVDYALDGERYRDEGLEIYVLAPSDADESPVVVWRQQQLLNQRRLS